jgi:hypothetical protein
MLPERLSANGQTFLYNQCRFLQGQSIAFNAIALIRVLYLQRLGNFAALQMPVSVQFGFQAVYIG